VRFHFFSKWEGVFFRRRHYFGTKTSSVHYSSNQYSLPAEIEGLISVLVWV
jgi:hypothetical protein